MVERDRKHDAKKQRGRLDEGKLRASLEWNPEGDPNTQSPSNCGYPYGTVSRDGDVVGDEDVLRADSPAAVVPRG